MVKNTLKAKVYETRDTEWAGYTIRFVNYNDEWYAVLKDVCDAVGLRTDKLKGRIHPHMMERVKIAVSDHPKRVVRSRGDNSHRWMIIVNEAGIYQALMRSNKLEARQFTMWTADLLVKLRKTVGLEGYEAFRMTEPEIQDDIDWILDCLYVDTETQQVMVSVTMPGGDVDQVPLEEYRW